MKLSRRLDRIEAHMAPTRPSIGPGLSGVLKAMEENTDKPVWTPMTGWCRNLLADLAREAGVDEGLVEGSLDDALRRLRDAGLLID